jgi:glucosamine--fructose-6-phosphate aminotransferase (isomerizing)
MNSLIADIHKQPAILHSAIDSLYTQVKALAPLGERLRKGEFDRVVLTGMGGSFAVLQPTVQALVGKGFNAFAIEASELLYDYRALLTRKTLVVAVSQSGHSVEMIRLLDEVGGSSTIIGITNTPDSPLALRSSADLNIGAGPEANVSTKTYTCTLAALRLLTAMLTEERVSDAGAKLHDAVDAIDASLPAWERVAERLAEAMDDIRFMAVLGRGISRASAMAGALLMKETAKLPSEGMTGGQFRHGPIEILSPAMVITIFMGMGELRPLNVALADDLSRLGGRVLRVGSPQDNANLALPDVEESVLPLVEVVPMQLLASKLAARRGIEPGTFFYSKKVTTVE